MLSFESHPPYRSSNSAGRSQWYCRERVKIRIRLRKERRERGGREEGETHESLFQRRVEKGRGSVPELRTGQEATIRTAKGVIPEARHSSMRSL